MESAVTALPELMNSSERFSDSVESLPAVSSEVSMAGEQLTELLQSADPATVYSIPQVQSAGNPNHDSHSLGDAILRHMDTLGSSFRKKVDHVHEMLKTPPGTYSSQQMLQLQLEMSMVSIEIEVVGKGVQKAVQHADQLSKLQ